MRVVSKSKEIWRGIYDECFWKMGACISRVSIRQWRQHLSDMRRDLTLLGSKRRDLRHMQTTTPVKKSHSVHLCSALLLPSPGLHIRKCTPIYGFPVKLIKRHVPSLPLSLSLSRFKPLRVSAAAVRWSCRRSWTSVVFFPPSSPPPVILLDVC